MIPESPAAAPERRVIGESRWPMALAVLAVAILTLVLPRDLVFQLRVPPVVEVILLVAVIISDPGKIDRVSKRVHALSVTLIAFIALSALWGTGLLIVELIRGGQATESGGNLLAAGAGVFVINCISFGLLYWELDCGRPAVRAHGLPAYPDFAFPQQQSPEFAPPDWRPRFVDHLYLGFITAVTFGPADVIPLRSWNKLAMMLQAAISLVLLGLVVARAVSVLR
jgi:hypothetical protein